MISDPLNDSRLLKITLVVSVLAHVAFALPLEGFRHLELTAPVVEEQTVSVNLQGPESEASATESNSSPAAGATEPRPDRTVLPVDEERAKATDEGSERSADVAQERPLLPPQETVASSVPMAASDVTPSDSATKSGSAPAAPRRHALPEIQPALRTVDEFLTTGSEKLSYRVSLLGVPVGTAGLEAKQERGGVRIALQVKSNPAISQIYPVDDSVETRHINGNFILTRIRQQEGSFRGDRGFTIFLRDRSVFWIDRLKNQTARESLPNSEVTDILSGLYYLRNQPLAVGDRIVLNLYDGNEYAPTTVEVLRRERLTLADQRETSTLVIQPHIRTEGIFRRNGDILVWLTDDAFRVPVRVETVIPLGKVTAELIAAETER
jgi:hypothetical protein